MFNCRICGSSSVACDLTAQELMFGTREEFRYLKCAECECLQIASIPSNLADYYAGDYYSLGKAEVPDPQRLSVRAKAARLRSCLGERDILGSAVRIMLGDPEMAMWFTTTGCSRSSRILDIGCGNGRLLLHLWSLGFKNLSGADPFIEEDIDYGNGVAVRKTDIAGVEGQFDLVMMHHSFEHLVDPLSALRQARDLMTDAGSILVRVPVSEGEAWETYQRYWFQLDAPRHIHLPTRKTMNVIAEKCGLRVKSVVFDSHAMQFWASEQYRAGIPLDGDRSYQVDPGKSMFSPAQIKNFAKRSRKLNAQQAGDQACFFLQVR